MVDSIRPTGRIGIIKPPGQPRPVEERNPSRQGRREQGREDPGDDREEAPPETTGASPGQEPGDYSQPAEDSEDRSPTGQHINVRI